MFLDITSSARSSCASSTSSSFTCKPASAQTWAMPLPICPAPMTPMVLIMCIAPCERSRRGRPAGPPSQHLAQLFVEFGNDLEHVAEEAVVGDLEDRRLLVARQSDV